jgi:flagellar hook-length control protein FliK
VNAAAAPLGLSPPAASQARPNAKSGAALESSAGAAGADSGSFDDCMKADSAAAEVQADAKADADADAKKASASAQDDGEDSDDGSSADAQPQGLGLVAMLLQTILEMPPRTDHSAVAGGAQPASPNPGLGALGAAAESPTPLLQPAADSSAGASTDPNAAALAVPAEAMAVPHAAQQALPDALLSLINASAPAGVAAGPASAPAAAASPPPALLHGDNAEPLAERIVWMADTARAQNGQGLQEARISLHPAELGSLQIRIRIDADGGTQVSFDVETPQARQAIEASLPQLRDLLSTQTVNAAAAAPSFELSGGLSQQQQQGWQQPQPRADTAAGFVNEGSDPVPASITMIRRGKGLLDQFA